jgi:hypothetical protein
MRCIGITALGALLCLAAPAKAELLVNISKSQQQAVIMIDGAETCRWPVSTGICGHETHYAVTKGRNILICIK